MHMISAQALEMRYAPGRTSNKAKKMTAARFLSRHLFFVPDGGSEGVWVLRVSMPRSLLSESPVS